MRNNLSHSLWCYPFSLGNFTPAVSFIVHFGVIAIETTGDKAKYL